MAVDSVFKGPLTGRFFRLSSCVSPGSSLVKDAMENAWSEGSGQGTPFSRRFCRGTVPHDGRLIDDDIDLSYCDDGTGVWRLWIREESRTAGRNTVELLASKMALQLDPDTPLHKMLRSRRSEIVSEARFQILCDAVPNVRIVPVVVVGDLVWIGRKSASTDKGYPLFLRHVLGDMKPCSMVWDELDLGWTQCSYAALLAFSSSNGGQIAPDILLTHIDIRGSSMQLKTADNNDEVQSIVSKITENVSEAAVKKLSFDVFVNGSAISLDIDEHGLSRCTPMRSMGGLSHERIRRRFSDVTVASSRLGELLSGLVSKVSDT